MTSPRGARLPRRWQSVLHTLLLAGGWLLFVLWWWQVIGERRGERDLWLLLVGAAIVTPALTLWWVWHNLALYRRLGPRRAVREVEPHYEVDFNGRTIDADWPALQGAALVVVEIDAGTKRYREPARTG